MATVDKPNGRVYNPRAPLPTTIEPGALRDPMSSWYKADRRAEIGPRPGPALLDQFGSPVDLPDLAHERPTDPTQDPQLRARASVIHREIPIVTTQTGWQPNDVRNAISSLVIGLFDIPSQLCDTVMADSRVSATLQSRTGGLLGRPVKHEIPKGFEDDDEAKLCRKIWDRNWNRIFPESMASEFLRWSVMQSFGIAQNVWDTSGKYWIPEPSLWHPRYSYYHWLYRCYVAISMDGQIPITPGDGSWVLHAPHLGYRGWMRGSVWSIAPWWLARNYALRDWARYSERHGMPILLALTPAAADPAQIGQYRGSLSTLGQETIVSLPQGVEPQYSYDLKLLEATDQGWLGFKQLIDQCNSEITLSIMGQNLTTEVKEGSFAAARVHADVRQSILQADARALERTIYQQIARPFAALNWGRPEIAPITTYDLEPYEDAHTQAQTFQAFGAAIMELRRAGKEVSNIVELAKAFGLNLRVAEVTDVEPLAGGSGGGGGGLR